MEKLKIGQKVKYIGTEFPKYTGKTYPISGFVRGGGVTLYTDEHEGLEGTSGAWGIALLAGLDEIEEVVEDLYHVAGLKQDEVYWFLHKNNLGEVVLATDKHYTLTRVSDAFLTEKEIKGYDPRYWAFAKLVEELEE